MGQTVKGTTRVCGLFGYPVHHTVSPAIHNTLADRLSCDLVYVPFEVEPEHLKEAFYGALSMDVLGLNVTIPHKSAVIPFLKEIDPMAKRIGAVNTLVRTADNSGFKGYNTDYFGIKKSFEEASCSLKDESVIILGAGGAARPAAFLCADEGAKEVFILNRTLKRAQELSDSVNDFAGKKLCSAMKLSDYKELDASKKYICFQATSVGLYPKSDEVIIDDENFYKLIHTGFDAIFKPYRTRFISMCEKQGAKCISGIRMLLHQGICAYELWNNVIVSEEDIRIVYGRMLRELLDDENIVLVGFMGSGKSAVSLEIADFLGYDRIDSDEAIEQKEDRTISDIFSTDGEEAFRQMETDFLKELIADKRKKTVLACGGGLPIREENRKLLKEFGRVIFLKAEPETVYDRVKDDTSRPLLQTGDVLGRIKKLQDDRRDIYDKACDFGIDTDKKIARAIAEEIVHLLL
ncbi:shikimate dehydrogenase [Butyrivibrio sp. NC2002]|uniref:shikimate dehydrogenase n=1 Tax=Butyrivibrio sp. NC2002 TaxID=1410610 RepID=UPI0005676021|nr:shikimate dehydrogenase [Butyrivibrio sp. NC2002]